MARSSITIAIDGPASSGKGTVARIVARNLGYAYIDSGSMYRAVALCARTNGVSWDNESKLAEMTKALDFSFDWTGSVLRLRVNGDDITEQLRNEDIGNGASRVAVYPMVRSVLLEQQRTMAAHGGVVMDGRDIGSVVLPDAELKIYLDASVAERARRRTNELQTRGVVVDFVTVEREIVARDEQDKNRSTAPLIQVEDAVYVDTTSRTAENAADEIVQMAMKLMR